MSDANTVHYLNPRKGTETHFSGWMELLVHLGYITLIPVRGRKLVVQSLKYLMKLSRTLP